MTTEERKFEILRTVNPTVINEELIPDGTGHCRPLILRYEAEECMITETRFYMFPASDPRHDTYTSHFEVTMKETN